MHAWQAKREQESPAASSLPPPSSAPYDDLAVPSSARTCCRPSVPPSVRPSVRPSHLRRLGQWRRRGRRAAANGSARRAQNEGSRVKTNDFYSGNQSEEERPRRRGRRTDDGRTLATFASGATCGDFWLPNHERDYGASLSSPLSPYNTSLALRCFLDKKSVIFSVTNQRIIFG